MPAEPWSIRYDFTFPDGREATFEVRLDPKSLVDVSAPPTEVPRWAALSFHQCPNCPLAADQVPACPVALRLSSVVPQFADTLSHSRAAVKVTVPERTYQHADVAVQAGLSGLLGVIMASAGCPVLGAMRPLLRFHLPFATETETVVRAASMYLLRQHFVARDGGVPDWSFEGLVRQYRDTSTVNRAFADRLRAAEQKDANANALVRLDMFARAIPQLIEDHLEELRFLFDGPAPAP